MNNDTPVRELTYRNETGETPNLAWTWFSDPRAIIDDERENGPRVIASAVGDGSSGDGDIGVVWSELETDTTGSATLRAGLERDDHNGAALYKRADGRILAMYTKHGSDSLTRWRLSAPDDLSTWSPEQTLDHGHGVTYNNIHPGDDCLYSFTRSVDRDPNVLVSTDDGQSWSYRGKLLTFRGRHRPYVRYASRDGEIHFVTTEGHPHSYENGVYHGVVRDDRLQRSDGTVVTEKISDEVTEAPVTDLTAVFSPNTRLGGNILTRAWTVDAAIDPDGNPVAIIQARVDDDRKDHRFLYASYTRGEWAVTPLATGGGYLYDGEWDYTGLAALNPTNPEQVVVSTPIDPRDDIALDRYTLFAGERGRSNEWSWEPIATQSAADDIRPIMIANESEVILLWLQGEYNSWTSWDTRVQWLSSPFGRESRDDIMT